MSASEQARSTAGEQLNIRALAIAGIIWGAEGMARVLQAKKSPRLSSEHCERLYRHSAPAKLLVWADSQVRPGPGAGFGFVRIGSHVWADAGDYWDAVIRVIQGFARMDPFSIDLVMMQLGIETRTQQWPPLGNVADELRITEQE